MYPHHLHNSPRPKCPEYRCNAEQKQLVEVIILKEELIHDIQADIRRVERARNLEEKPILSENGQDDYLLSRHIDTALNAAVARMQAYLLLPSPYAHRISTNHAYGWEEKSVYLALPQRWPPHLIDALRDAVHNYIVYDVEARLLQVALPEDKALDNVRTMARDCYDDINAHINARTGPAVIHPSFLG